MADDRKWKCRPLKQLRKQLLNQKCVHKTRSLRQNNVNKSFERNNMFSPFLLFFTEILQIFYHVTQSHQVYLVFTHFKHF